MTVVEDAGEFCPIPDDHDDEKFTAAALSSGAEFIAATDHHLLDLKTCRDCRIVTARELVDELRARGAVL